MPSAYRAVPSLSLVVSWPGDVSGACAEQLAQRLAEARIGSTWAVEDPAQAASLKRYSQTAADFQWAFMVSQAGNIAEAVDRGLKIFERARQEVAAIQVDRGVGRGSIERRLRQSGVRVVIAAASRGRSTILRPLPFGVWEFSPQLTAPGARRWLPSRTRQKAYLLSGNSHAIASIDLAKLAAARSRGWQSIERLIDQAAAAAGHGTARLMQIAEVVAELSALTATRPQRSILRAAA
jgi:hypothetical protein